MAIKMTLQNFKSQMHKFTTRVILVFWASDLNNCRKVINKSGNRLLRLLLEVIIMSHMLQLQIIGVTVFVNLALLLNNFMLDADQNVIPNGLNSANFTNCIICDNPGAFG